MTDLAALTADQLAEKVLLPLNRRIPGTGFEYREALVSLAELQTRANLSDGNLFLANDNMARKDAAEARAVAAEKERDEALATLQHFRECADTPLMADVLRDKQAAEARLAETQDALERYGQHDANCNSEDGDPNYCTCGLRAALTTHPEGKP